MRQIKYSIIAIGALALLASCNKTDFTPATGDTPVQFAEAVQVFSIENQYFDIPVFQTEKSDKATQVNVKILSCSGAYTNGNAFNYVEDSTVIFTSKSLYVGPWNEQEDTDTTFGSSSFEVRLPEYDAIDSLVLELQLEGEYLGSQTTATCIFRSVEQYNMVGTFYFNGDGQQTMRIAAAPGTDPNAYNITFPTLITDNNPAPFKATRSINKLMIETGVYYDNQDWDWTLYSMIYMTEDDGAPSAGWYITTDYDIELTFKSDDEFIVENGLYIVHAISETQGYAINVEVGNPGLRSN